MAYRPTKIGALIILSPKEARAQIMTAFVRAGADRERTAILLGCRRSTLYEWIGKLKMKAELRAVAQIAKRDGWHYSLVRKSSPIPDPTSVLF